MIPYSAWRYCDENKMYEVEGFEVAASSPAVFDLHHKLGSLCGRTMQQLIDSELYYYRPPNELKFMRHADHMEHHRQMWKNPLLREQLRRLEMKKCYERGFDLTPWMLSEEECIKLNEEIKEFKNNFNL